jgi:hypothetical protein
VQWTAEIPWTSYNTKSIHKDTSTLAYYHSDSPDVSVKVTCQGALHALSYQLNKPATTFGINDVVITASKYPLYSFMIA